MLPLAIPLAMDARPADPVVLLPLLWPVEFLVITRHPFSDTTPLLRHWRQATDHIDHMCARSCPMHYSQHYLPTIGYLVAGWLVAI